MYPILLLVAAAATADPPTPPDRVEDRDPVLRWNQAALQAIKQDRTPPPMAARNLAILHASIYDAVNAIDRSHAVYHVAVEAPAGASMEAAAAGAAHDVLTRLYPKEAKRFDAILDDELLWLPEGLARDDGLVLGRDVAARMLAWRADDGSAQGAVRLGVGAGAVGADAAGLPAAAAALGRRDAVRPGPRRTVPAAAAPGDHRRALHHRL